MLQEVLEHENKIEEEKTTDNIEVWYTLKEGSMLKEKPEELQGIICVNCSIHDSLF